MTMQGNSYKIVLSNLLGKSWCTWWNSKPPISFILSGVYNKVLFNYFSYMAHFLGKVLNMDAKESLIADKICWLLLCRNC